jgi:hypothetical protein
MEEWGIYTSRRGRRLQKTEEYCIMNTFMICAPHQSYSVDEVKKVETVRPEVLRRKIKTHTGF